MNCKYLIASIVGLIAGLVVFLLWANFSISPVADWSRVIPQFDYEHPIGPEFKRLMYYAVVLRTSLAYLNSGFWFTALGPVFVCVLVKLTEAGKKSPILRYLSLSIWSSVLSVVLAFLLGFAFAGSAAIGSADWEQAIRLALWMGTFFADMFVFGMYGILWVPVAALGLLCTLDVAFAKSDWSIKAIKQSFMGLSKKRLT